MQYSGGSPLQTALAEQVCVLTFTDAGLLVQVVPSRALTLEAPKCVDTVAPLAQARKLMALVYICFPDTANEREKTEREREREKEKKERVAEEQREHSLGTHSRARTSCSSL